MKKATSTDVARLAGVSQTTVSLVMSGSPNTSISEETRRKVTRAAEELGYTLPARKNRVPKNPERRMLLLFVPTLTNHYYTDLARLAEDYAETRNCQVVICNTFRRPELEKQYLETLGNGPADGIIYTFLPGDPKQTELLSRRVPTVIIGEKQEDLMVFEPEGFVEALLS